MPFSFVLDALDALDPVTRPMFGCQAVYIGPKLMLILREKSPSDDDNGVWVSTEVEHHDSLRAQLPSLRAIKVFGPIKSGWQCIPSEGDHFEDEVLRVCAMIRNGDLRVGRVPGKKRTASKRKK
jgi:hypothetical protein